MNYVVQALWILGFYGAGLAMSRLIGGFVPGSILGMLFLFAALSSGIIKERRVEGVARLLIRYMVLFFLPASVGIMVIWDTVAANLWTIILTAAISTVLVIAVVGIVQQKLGRRW